MNDAKVSQSKLKVVMLAGGFPHPDNIISGIFNFRAALALRNYADIHVVHLRSWRPGRSMVRTLEYQDIPVTTLAVPQLPRAFILNTLVYQHVGWPLVRRLLRGCDIVHSVGADVGVIGSVWTRRGNVRHLTQVIGSDINSILPRVRSKPGVRGWDSHLHGVSCDSKALATAFQALYPNGRNIRTVYRGTDLEEFNPDGPANGPLVGRAPVRFLFLGGFPPYPDLPHRANTKGGETLLAAWKIAEKRISSASLLVGGPCSAQLRSVVEWRGGLRYPQNVYVGQSPLANHDVPAYIRSSDAVLIPSMEEGLPVVSMEAAACGRAVFGSNVGGLPEVIRHGETGLILPPGDVQAWADALVEFGEQSATLRQMGEQARKRAETVFDQREFGRNMHELYKTVLNEPLHHGSGASRATTAVGDGR